MVLLTQKQLPVVLKLDLYSSFFWGGGGGTTAQTTVTMPTLRASFEVNLCPPLSDFKTKNTVAKPISLAKREWLVGENPTRNDAVAVVQN